MTSQVRMTIVIRTGVGKTPNVTPDRFSPARTATPAAEADEANRTRAGAPLREAVIAYRITRRISASRARQYSRYRTLMSVHIFEPHPRNTPIRYGVAVSG
jgi:hypothetical protein